MIYGELHTRMFVYTDTNIASCIGIISYAILSHRLQVSPCIVCSTRCRQLHEGYNLDVGASLGGCLLDVLVPGAGCDDQADTQPRIVDS